MKKVLVLGAGFVTRPLVRYLLDQPDYRVTVGDCVASKAEALVEGHANGAAEALVAGDNETIGRLVSEHDLAVSLLPAPLHPMVAQYCIRHGKHMVTASYVSPEMQALDGQAREKGLMILNEIGADPGIDHMSATRIIDDVKRRGGKVTSFRSYCGGLPAPADNNNPMGYKFSWSPRGVCTAGKNAARYREHGKQIDIPGAELFANVAQMEVEGLGTLDAYPNRDSLVYIDTYGLAGIDTMLRGTFRYPGWCETMKKIAELGLLDESPVTYPAGTTHAQFMATLFDAESTGNLRKRLADHLGIEEGSAILDRFEWLGLLSDEPIAITEQETTPLDVLALRMERTLAYAPGERDMVVLCHYFTATFPDAPDEHITSTLIAYGQPDGDSAMARTVTLPVAIATKMTLSGEIMLPGVCVPVQEAIYKPVLDELATLGIRFVEKTETVG